MSGQAAAISGSLAAECLNVARSGACMVPAPGTDKGRLRRREVKLESASSSSSSSRGRALRPGLQSSGTGYLGPASADRLYTCPGSPPPGEGCAVRCSATGPYTPVINCLLVLSTLFIRDRLCRTVNVGMVYRFAVYLLYFHKVQKYDQ